MPKSERETDRGAGLISLFSEMSQDCRLLGGPSLRPSFRSAARTHARKHTMSLSPPQKTKAATTFNWRDWLRRLRSVPC